MTLPVHNIESIAHQGVLIGILLPARPLPTATTFYTSDHLPLQCGRIVYGAGSEIPPHIHPPVERTVLGTPEVVIVEKGRVVVDLYATSGTPIGSRELGVGDAIILLGGGHGFRMLDDSVLLEVKQGPYLGLMDKLSFS